jgi:hypothetical protein
MFNTAFYQLYPIKTGLSVLSGMAGNLWERGGVRRRRDNWRVSSNVCGGGGPSRTMEVSRLPHLVYKFSLN